MDEPLPEHGEISDALAARRYFTTVDRALRAMPRVAAELGREGKLSTGELGMISRALARLDRSFAALDLKYPLTSAGGGPGLQPRLAIDRHQSGLPEAGEILHLATDAMQAAERLAALPSEAALREQMLQQILGRLTVPTLLRQGLSQRLYYQLLHGGGLFLARNDLQALWLSESEAARHWLLGWSVYDGQVNLPVIYLMEVEDRGELPLPKDLARWPFVQTQLMAQSLNWLKLSTIAQGFDADFADLRSKGLKRLQIGPLYSAVHSLQRGPVGALLAESAAPEGQDWALIWTLERLGKQVVPRDLASRFTREARQDLSRELSPTAGAGSGGSLTERGVVLPQVLSRELAADPPSGLRDLTRFCVAPSGSVLRVS